MFIISLSYICDLKEVDKILPEHIDYLKIQYKKGNFNCIRKKSTTNWRNYSIKNKRY
jgi:uncharacterized protein YciI